jgi:predicted dehydrogenase
MNEPNMNKNVARIGIIGLGWHAKNVILPALINIENIRLVCACTAHKETAVKVEDSYRLKCYVGYEEMLEKADIDGVIVAGNSVSVSGIQEDMIIKSLAADKHVFSETPGIKTFAGAEKIIKLRNEKNKVVMIGRCLRFSPLYQQMKSIFDKWRAEDISEHMIIARYYSAAEHIYDLLLFLNGRINKLSVHGNDTQEIVSLEFKNGDIGAVIIRQFNNPAPEYEMVEISSAGGVLRAMNGNNLIFHRTAKQISPKDSLFNFDAAHYEGNSANFSFPYAGMRQLYMRGYIPELENFASLIFSGNQDNNLSSVENALQLLYIREGLTKSKKTKEWINIKS